MVLLFGYGAAESASYYFLLEFVLYIIGRKEGRGISSQGEEMRKIDKKIYAKLVHGHDKTVENNERKLNDVIVEVTGKTSKPADINNWEYEDWVGFTLSVSNNTDKVIKGIQGTLEINDIFGEKIMRLNADLLGKTINQGETVVIDDMGYSVNPFINKDVQIYELEYEDLKFNYIIRKIAFEDGTFLEYE